jgi:hypothetical protein
MDQLLEQLLSVRAMWRWRFWGLAAAWLVGSSGTGDRLPSPREVRGLGGLR